LHISGKLVIVGVYLICNWNNLEACFRNSLWFLGDAPREFGDCLVGFYCPSLGGSITLRDFVGLLYLEGTKSRIAYSISIPATNSITST
jgi:hypothetical protein